MVYVDENDTINDPTPFRNVPNEVLSAIFALQYS